MSPLGKVPADDQPWYINVPCDVDTLQSIIPKMSDQAETSVRYSNHSLRATSASRLFASNVPEKIIQEKTGHRSLVGLRGYERTTTEQERIVTKILSSIEQGREMGLEEPKVEEIPKPEAENEEQPKSAPVFSGHIQNRTFNFYAK